MNIVAGHISRSMVWALVCMFFLSSSVLPLRGAQSETSMETSSGSKLLTENSSENSKNKYETIESSEKNSETAENSGDEKERSLLESGVRWGLAFSATSLIKGWFGMAPGYLAAFLPSMGASMFVPALIGAGLLEGLISLSVFSAITGVKDRKWLTRSFLLASVVSVSATFFLAGMMSSLALTLVSNGLRLAVFAMLTRPADKSVKEHIVDEVKEVVGVGDGDEADDNEGDLELNPEDSSKSSNSISEIEILRQQAYSDYINSSDSNERTGFYYDFKKYSELLNDLREDALHVQSQ